VGHDDRGAFERTEKSLEQCKAGEVEIVRRLVEQQHVDATQEDRCEGDTSSLQPPERVRERALEVDRQAELGRAPAVWPRLEVTASTRRGTPRAPRNTPMPVPARRPNAPASLRRRARSGLGQYPVLPGEVCAEPSRPGNGSRSLRAGNPDRKGRGVARNRPRGPGGSAPGRAAAAASTCPRPFGPTRPIRACGADDEIDAVGGRPGLRDFFETPGEASM